VENERRAVIAKNKARSQRAGDTCLETLVEGKVLALPPANMSIEVKSGERERQQQRERAGRHTILLDCADCLQSRPTRHTQHPPDKAVPKHEKKVKFAANIDKR
jgi:hypothetical protein